MHFSTALLTGVLALVSSAIAAPTEGKPFKLGVTTKEGKVLYLTERPVASEQKAEGIDCVIVDGKIGCGPQKLGYTYGDMHTSSPLVPTLRAANNKNWSIGQGNAISWKTNSGKEVHFSTKPFSGNKIYAEICSTYGHPDAKLFIPGVPKAYFV